ncbi:hypothetical protein PENTCL1PPCAC_6043, partial [Pristionchus entomophagus]
SSLFFPMATLLLLLSLLPAVLSQWNQGPYQPQSNGQYQNNNWNGPTNGVYQEGNGGFPNNGGYNNNWNQPQGGGPLYDDSGNLISNGNNYNNYNNNNNNQFNNNNGFNQQNFGNNFNTNGWETITTVGYGSVPMELAWRAAREEVNRGGFFGRQSTTNPMIPVSISKALKNGSDMQMEVTYAEGNCYGTAISNGQVDLTLISQTNCVQKPLGQRAVYSVSETRSGRGGSRINVRKMNDITNGQGILG